MLELSFVGLPLYGIISEWDYPCVELSMHEVICVGELSVPALPPQSL